MNYSWDTFQWNNQVKKSYSFLKALLWVSTEINSWEKIQMQVVYLGSSPGKHHRLEGKWGRESKETYKMCFVEPVKTTKDGEIQG